MIYNMGAIKHKAITVVLTSTDILLGFIDSIVNIILCHTRTENRIYHKIKTPIIILINLEF